MLTAPIPDQVGEILNGKVSVLSYNLDAARVWSYALNQRGIEPLTMQIDQTYHLAADLDSHNLIIVDHYQSPIDIFPICQQVRANTTQPILLLTYETDERHHLKAYETGVEECMAKPIGIPMFLAKAFAWLRRDAIRKTTSQELLFVKSTRKSIRRPLPA